MNSLLLTAVGVELVLDVLGIVYALGTGNRVAVPGGVVRALLMGTFGWLAVRRSSRWARLSFCGVEYATAGCGLLLAFFTVPGGQLRFEPVALAIFVVYGLLGAMATAGRGGGEMRHSPERVAL
jgi:hypothetical protein